VGYLGQVGGVLSVLYFSFLPLFEENHAITFSGATVPLCDKTLVITSNVATVFLVDAVGSSAFSIII
jgi:hypothetical protein